MTDNIEYGYALTSSTSWTNAKTEAENQGGRLVVIEDQAEQDFLFDTFGGSEDLWIGLTDEAEEDTFKWINGDSLDYTNWNGGEPNNAGGTEHYIHIGTNGTWNDNSDSRNYKGIIEFTKPEVSSGYLLSDSKTWDAAQAEAEDLGGYLVEINDAEEQQFLEDTFDGDFWIGLTDRQNEGTFKWVNSESENYTEPAYSNWNAGEPNNAGGTEDYTIVRGDGLWNDETGSKSFSGIIELSDKIVPSGDEFRVNTYTTESQRNSAVTALNDGGFVVIWDSDEQDGSSDGIYGQRYDGNGSAVDSEFQVNTETTGYQGNSAVTVLNDGGFVVTWDSNGQDSSGSGVYGQRYDASGNAVGEEFQVNTYTNNGQRYSAVTALNDGGFVVTWQSDWQDGSFGGIYGQQYNASGSPVNDEFKVNTKTTYTQQNSAVTALNDGGFVVTWQSDWQDGSNFGIYGQRYDASGNTVGKEFQINTYTNSSQSASAVTALNDGGFVVTWQSSGQDGSSDGIYGQRYDASGNTVGKEFQVNTETNSIQQYSAVTALNDGGFVVTWQSSGQDGSNFGIYGQRYDASGNTVGSEFQVNTYTNSSQSASAVTALNDGGFVVTWNSYEQDGSDNGIYGQIFASEPIVNFASVVATSESSSTDGAFNLTLRETLPSDFTIPYTISGTATSGVDYQALSGSVTFAAGNTTATIPVTAIDDDLDEGSETIILDLGGGLQQTMLLFDDRPEFISGFDPYNFTTIKQDNTDAAGDTVADIITDGTIATGDGAAVEAIALTAVDNTNGTWQYQLNGQTNWTDVSTVSDSNALLLDSSDKLRFVPNANYSGTADVSFHLWSKATGMAGDKVDTASGDFSLDSTTAEIMVKGPIVVNQPLDNGLGDTPGTLSYAIVEANTNPGADTIQIDSDVRLDLAAETKRLPEIDSDIIINGNNYSISGDNDNDGSIDIDGEDRSLLTVSSGNVEINNLTLTNGVAKGEDGAGGGAGMGGALYINDGDVTVNNVDFVNNRAIGGNGASAGEGGDGVFGSGGSAGTAGSDGTNGVTATFDFGSFEYTPGTPGDNGSDGGDASSGGFGAGGGAGGDGGHGGSGDPAGHGGRGGFGGDGGFGAGGGAGGDGGDGGYGGDVGTGGTGNYGGNGGDGGFGAGDGDDGDFGAGDGYYFSSNSSSGGGGAGMGGAVFIRSGSLTLDNASFDGNEVAGGDGGKGLGGAIFALDTLNNTNDNNLGMPTSLPTVTIDNVTYTNNVATDDASIATDNDNAFGTTAPAAVNDSTTIQLDTSVTLSVTDNDVAIDITTIDLDPTVAGQQTTLTVAEEGTFTANSTGNVTFAPVSGFTGVSTVNYTVNGNASDASNSASADFEVKVNNPPTAADNNKTTPISTTVTFSVTDDDTDSDGTIDVTTVDLDPTVTGQQTTLTVAGEGTFTADNEGNVTFAPVSEFLGTSTIDYTVNDNDGATSNNANISVAVVNTPPTVANEIPDQTALVGEAFSYQFAENTFSDLDGDDLNYSAALAGKPGLPPWLQFDWKNRIFSSVSTPDNTQRNIHKIKVTASDGKDSVSDIFDLALVNESVDGSQGGHKGGDSDDGIAGGGTPDEIRAGGGNDVVAGLGGKDRLHGEKGSDRLDGGADDDFLQGGEDNDTVSGGADNDFLFGELGNDSLTGDDGDDVIIGGAGDDFLDGGAGIDRLTGREGSDTFVLEPNDPNNIFYDFADGIDNIAVGPASFDSAISTVAELFDGTGTDLAIAAGSSDPLTTTISYDGMLLATVYEVGSSNLDVSDFVDFNSL